MKLLKVFSGLVFAAAAFASVNSSADTLVPVSCSWNVVQIVSIPVSPGGTVTVSNCTDTATNTVAATKAIGSNGSNACSLSAASGYQVSGNCYSPSVFKVIPSVTACAQAGAVYPYNISVGLGQPAFPTAAVNQFCGVNSNPNCGFTTTVVTSGPTGAILKATCVSLK